LGREFIINGKKETNFVREKGIQLWLYRIARSLLLLETLVEMLDGVLPDGNRKARARSEKEGKKG